MLKPIASLRSPDPYFAGTHGFVGSSLEAMHREMSLLELPTSVPEAVRRCHDAVRHTYIYSFYSYDLLAVAAAQTFPCLELALRLRVSLLTPSKADQKEGPRRPAMFRELLKIARREKLINHDIESLALIRNMFAHGSEAVLNPPLFLGPFKTVTSIIGTLFEGRASQP